jgi:hypothetical protein
MSNLQSMWDEFLISVENLKKDVSKNLEKHNVSAGIRVRKGLRALRKQALVLIKETLSVDKEVTKVRKTSKVK